jgi:hypothetical protein
MTMPQTNETNPTTIHPNTNPTAQGGVRAPLPESSQEALAKAKADAAKIPEKDFVVVRVDVGDAAYGVLGCMPLIERIREDVIGTFGDEGRNALDGVVPAARVLLLAQAAVAAASGQDLEPVAQRLREKRDILQTLCDAAVKRGFGDKKTLEGLTRGGKYGSLADDTRALVHWFRANAGPLGEHSKLSEADLTEIDHEAEQFGYTDRLRERVRAGNDPVVRDRNRAFTHFVQAYETLRKLVTFVRWHEADYDRIAPSIYAGRTPRRDIETPPTPPVVTPIAPGMPGAPVVAPTR